MVSEELKTAQIEFNPGNIAEAKAALSGTAARLKALVETVRRQVATGMRIRLDLILTGMATDSATAQTDLVLLAKNLQSVETLLFIKK